MNVNDDMFIMHFITTLSNQMKHKSSLIDSSKISICMSLVITFFYELLVLK